MRFLLFVILLPLVIAAFSGELCAQEKIVLQDAPTSREQALAKLASQTLVAQQAFDAAKMKFDQAVQAAEQSAVADLKQVARNEAARGEIPLATEAWTEVVKLDPNDEDAKKFLTTINRLDIVKKYSAEAKVKAAPARAKLRVEFRTESGRLFKKLPSGKWSDTGHAPGHQEVYRDDSMVILRDPQGIEHALLSGSFIWGSRKDRTGTDRHLWWDGELGAWLK